MTTSTIKHTSIDRRSAYRSVWLSFAAALLTSACATTTPRPVTSAPRPPSTTTQVYFYPTKGQSAARQDRDRYECYRWSVKETGFDPSASSHTRHPRMQVAASPSPGHGTASGAVAGAVIGSVVASPWHSAEGAVVGALAGAMIGAASDAAREERAERMQSRWERREYARLEWQAQDYRRAMAACLEARGYTVR